MVLHGGGESTMQAVHESHSVPPHSPHLDKKA